MSSPLLTASPLKLSADSVAPLLARIACLSFEAGTFQSRCKVGRVVQLYKQPRLNNNNRRLPSTNQQFMHVSKIAVKVGAARLQPQLLQSGHFSTLQSGQRAGHSADTDLFKISTDIRLAADEDRCTELLATEILTAVDLVSLGTLLWHAGLEF